MAEKPKEENGKAPEEVRPKWTDMNNILKIYKYYSKTYSWMHLVVAEGKFSKKKFLRLKKYYNWFSIPDAGYLAVMQGILKKGAKELEWEYNEDFDVNLEEVSDKKEKKQILQSIEGTGDSGLPEEILEFIKKFPDFTKKLIALDLDNKKPEEILEVMNMTADAISASGDRFRVAFQELLSKISKEEPKSMMELSDLMEKWNLHQITSLSNIVKTRLDTIESLEKAIHKEETYELKEDNSIHRILEKNMWLIDERYWIAQSNKSLRTYLGDEMMKEDAEFKFKRPDFVCVNKSEKGIIILEIKRPSIELKKKEIDQAELYLRLIDKYKGEPGLSVDVYLIGAKISKEAQEVVKWRKNITIKTYQDFLEDCRNRYQEYLKISEK